MTSDPQSDSATLLHNSGFAGTTLNNRYVIDRELKRGGFGIVYLARDLQLHGRRVVVKVLLEESHQSNYVVQKFRQEIEALSRIDHPGVVGIVDAGELKDGKPFIVMQYVDGATLRSIMSPEGMDFAKAADIIRQIGRALTAAHEKGIFHRDLKPENVMLQDLGHGEEQVKVIDFGIAKIKDSTIAPSTAANVTAGTVSYMAPEQLSGLTITAATDVYSFAEIAYEMLTGRKPFNPETGYDLLGLQQAGVPIHARALRPAVSVEAESTIFKALSFEPTQRHASARAFGDELARALDGKSVTSESVPRATAIPQPTQLASEVTPVAQSASAAAYKTVAQSFPFVPPGAGPSEPASAVPQRGSRSRLVLVLVGALLLLAPLGGWFLYHKLKAKAPNPIADNSTVAERNLSYWLTVQKMREGRPYQDSFDSSGQEIFENGWKFVVNIESPQPGYLYLLNEGLAADGVVTFNLLFPAPSANAGASFVPANQAIKTGNMVFDDNQGTEKFWLVWAAKPVPELEAVRGVVNEREKGALGDSNQEKGVRDFLNAHYSSSKSGLKIEKVNRRTSVKTTGDVLVNLIELEHH